MPKLKTTIGAPTVASYYGVGVLDKEEQLLMTEKELRVVVNALYENVQTQKHEKIFDMMIFRELKGQLFWN